MKRKIVSAILAILLLVLVLPACAPSVDQTQLDELNAQLAEKENQITGLQGELGRKDSQIAETAKQVDELKAEVAAQKSRVTSLQGELNVKDTRITELEAELAELPKDPSYDQLMEFMAQDKTNEDDYWGHDDYAQVFLRNARNAGIQGYVVTIWIAAQQTWFLTGFETTDEGWVYIIPAADLEVKLEVGEEYHKLNNFDPFGFDDTIEKIVVFD